MCIVTQFLPPVTMSITSGKVTSDQRTAGSCLARNIICLKRLCVIAARSAEWISSVA